MEMKDYYVTYNPYDYTYMLDEWVKKHTCTPNRSTTHIPPIKNVIFNNPATIVFWADDTKTVVKCENEDFDPEKGLAMAISKKAFGNQGNYFNQFKKWTEKYYEDSLKFTVSDMAKALAKVQKVLREFKMPDNVEVRIHTENEGE